MDKKKHYLRFAWMIATSVVVMWLLMYLNTYAWEHVLFSETRAYMAIMMGAAMAVVMLAWMLGMYPDRKLNIGIFVAAGLVFALSLWLVRSQATISGTSYLRAMIPHHSIAILTSERARIRDPRVRKLADEIIEAQRREIAEMRYLIARAGQGSAPAQHFRDPPPVTGSVADALDHARISTLDPAPMPAAQADELLPDGGRCRFHRSAEAQPVLWATRDGTAAAMKLNGVLVKLDGEADAPPGVSRFSTDGASMTVRVLGQDADAVRQDADLEFSLSQGLSVGYRGIWTCDAPHTAMTRAAAHLPALPTTI